MKHRLASILRACADWLDPAPFEPVPDFISLVGTRAERRLKASAAEHGPGGLSA